MRIPRLAVSTLLAAGLTPLPVLGDDDSKAGDHSHDSLTDRVRSIVTSIGDSYTYTLAQHRSHASHGSHKSHSSHRSGGVHLVRDAVALASGTRNEASTPPNSVLPSSPAIARKLKILPGNSPKFREVVLRTQIALLAQGYQVGEVNGELHARTVAALYRYQETMGEVPSGRLTDTSLSLLGIVAQ